MASIKVRTREDRDKLHDYIWSKLGAGPISYSLSRGGAPPNCYVADKRLTEVELKQFAKNAGIKVLATDALSNRRSRLHAALDCVMDSLP
jgi:hypothetical protein